MQERGDTMLDEKDLQAIAQLMAQQKKEIIGEVSVLVDQNISASESRMMTMMESYFDPKFNLLAEEIKLIREKLPPSGAVKDLESRVDTLETVAQLHSQEIAKLKMTQ